MNPEPSNSRSAAAGANHPLRGGRPLDGPEGVANSSNSLTQAIPPGAAGVRAASTAARTEAKATPGRATPNRAKPRDPVIGAQAPGAAAATEGSGAISQPERPLGVKAAVRQLSAEKGEAILAGARSEFLSHGYAATSMDRVAAAAGVSKATVYSHFTDKETLFESLTQQMVGEKVAHLFGAGEAESLPNDPRQALAELAHRCLEPCEGQNDFLAFFRLVVGESERFPQLARTFVGQLEQHAFPQVFQLFAAGSFHTEVAPEVSARVFIGSMVHLILMQDLLHGSEVVRIDRSAFAAGLIRLLSP